MDRTTTRPRKRALARVGGSGGYPPSAQGGSADGGAESSDNPSISRPRAPSRAAGWDLRARTKGGEEVFEGFGRRRALALLAHLFDGASGTLLYTYQVVGTSGGWGRTVTLVGSVDADGIADVLVGSNLAAALAGKAVVYAGDDVFLNANPKTIAQGAASR